MPGQRTCTRWAKAVSGRRPEQASSAGPSRLRGDPGSQVPPEQEEQVSSAFGKHK